MSYLNSLTGIVEKKRSIASKTKRSIASILKEWEEQRNQELGSKIHEIISRKVSRMLSDKDINKKKRMIILDNNNMKIEAKCTHLLTYLKNSNWTVVSKKKEYQGKRDVKHLKPMMPYKIKKFTKPKKEKVKILHYKKSKNFSRKAKRYGTKDRRHFQRKK